jgi:uncharacterized membrane protein
MRKQVIYMNTILSFLKATAQGGLLILLPLLLFILLLMEIIELVVGLATPIADLFPAGTFEDPRHPVALAAFLLFGASLLIGLAMESAAAIRLGNWIEQKTIGKLQLYQFVKSLVSGLLGAEKGGKLQPALFDAGHGVQEIAYIVEDLKDGTLAVLFPYAPTGFAGPVKIVPRERIETLDASLGDVSLMLNHMGLGAGALLKKRMLNSDPQASKVE